MKHATSLLKLCCFLVVIALVGSACKGKDDSKQKELEVRREMLIVYQNKLNQLDTELQNLSKDYETAYEKIRDSQASIEAKLQNIKGITEEIAKHEALLTAQEKPEPDAKEIPSEEPKVEEKEEPIIAEPVDEDSPETTDDETESEDDKKGVPFLTIILNAIAVGLIFVLFVVLFRLKNSSGEDFEEEPEVIVAKSNETEESEEEPERKEISIDITDEEAAEEAAADDDEDDNKKDA